MFLQVLRKALAFSIAVAVARVGYMVPLLSSRTLIHAHICFKLCRCTRVILSVELEYCFYRGIPTEYNFILVF